MIDNKGQISLEYLLIFSISLIILIAFTLPIVEIAIEDTFDISNSLNTKSEMMKLSNAITQVYSEGQGSKQSVNLNLNSPVTLNIYNSYISTSITLHDNSKKSFKVLHNSNLAPSTLSLQKGNNSIVVEWPIKEEYMIISKQF